MSFWSEIEFWSENEFMIWSDLDLKNEFLISDYEYLIWKWVFELKMSFWFKFI